MYLLVAKAAYRDRLGSTPAMQSRQFYAQPQLSRAPEAIAESELSAESSAPASAVSEAAGSALNPINWSCLLTLRKSAKTATGQEDGGIADDSPPFVNEYRGQLWNLLVYVVFKEYFERNT